MRNLIKWLKNHYIAIGCIAFFTLLFSIALFTDSLYLGDDLYFHLNRINGIGNAIRDGQILPKLYPLTNFEFGYASPLFYCDVFMYPAALLYMLGVPLIISYKFTLFFYIFLGTLLSYLCANALFKNKYNIIFIVMSIYCLNPYRFIDAYYRSAFSEFLAITFFPLLLYAFVEVFYRHKDRFILLAISMTCILLSHNLSFLLILIVYILLIIIYSILYPTRIKNIFYTSIKAGIIGFLLTAFYTLPMLEQLLDQIFKVSSYAQSYDISTNIISMFSTFNLFNIVENSIFSMADIQRFGIGMVSLLIPILNYKHFKNKWILAISCMHYLFLGLAFGWFPIYDLEILNFLQFSFRFYLLIYLTSIILVSYALIYNNCMVKVIVILLMAINICLFNYHMMTTDNQLNNDDEYSVIFAYDVENQSYYDNKQTGVGEYLPIIQEDDYMLDSRQIKTIVNGEKVDLEIEYNRYMSHIEFEYESEETIQLMLPLTYYKGYKAYAIGDDGETIELLVYNDDVYKKVSIDSLSGNYTYSIQYQSTIIQDVSLWMTLITLIMLLVCGLKNKNI
ncbi:MAG: hypothetical protein R3Y57_04245 [Erysipelotrichaceae bacterium]